MSHSVVIWSKCHLKRAYFLNKWILGRSGRSGSDARYARVEKHKEGSFKAAQKGLMKPVFRSLPEHALISNPYPIQSPVTQRINEVGIF